MSSNGFCGGGTLTKRLRWSEPEQNNFQYLRKAGEWGGLVRRRESLRHVRQNRRFDVEQMMEVESKVREGSTRLLATCEHDEQRLQAAKTLITSDQRMACYVRQLKQQRLTDTSLSPRPSAIAGISRLGTLCVSDIRLPLVWPASDFHLSSAGIGSAGIVGGGCGVSGGGASLAAAGGVLRATGCYAVFCVVRVGSEVYDTALAIPVDSSLTDVTFDDVFVFEQVEAEFVCSLEVYCHTLQPPLDGSMAAASRRIRTKLSASVTRTLGRKMAASLRKHSLNQHSGGEFQCVGVVQLRAADLHESVRSHILHSPPAQSTTTSTSSSTSSCSLSARGSGTTPATTTTDLPLFGQLCCRVAAAPDCASASSSSAHSLQDCLSVKWSDECEASRMFVQLRGFQLRMWPEHCDRDATCAAATLTIDKNTEVSGEPPLCVSINNSGGVRDMHEHKGRVALHLPSQQRQDAWLHTLLETTHISEIWCRAGECEMTILTPSSRASSASESACLSITAADETTDVTRLARASLPRRSLYDHVSLQEDTAASPVLPPFKTSAQLNMRHRSRRLFSCSQSLQSRLSSVFVRFGSLRGSRAPRG